MKTLPDTSSEASNRNLQDARTIGEFFAKNKENMITLSFSEYLMSLLGQKGLKRADVIRDSGLGKSYVFQIFQGERKPSRDKLIAIAFGLHLGSKETQRMLKLGGCSELYARVPRDAVILFAIQRGMDIDATEDLLYSNGFPTLLGEDK